METISPTSAPANQIAGIQFLTAESSGASGAANNTTEVSFISTNNTWIMRASAAHVLHCVNSHAGLVDALKQFIEHVEACDERSLLRCDIDPHTPSVFSVLAEHAKAVLARAEEE